MSIKERGSEMVTLKEHISIVEKMAEDYRSITTLEGKLEQEKNFEIYVKIISPSEDTVRYLRSVYYKNRENTNGEKK